jgi:hypothetical protein
MSARILALISALTVVPFIANYGVAEATASGRRTYIQYPAFGDRLPLRGPGRVEMAHDKGLVVELTIRCGAMSAIVTYSRIERLYCGPDHRCSPRLADAARSACSGHH